MLKVGAQDISALYLGGQKIKKAYLGSAVVFDAAPSPVSYTVTVAVDPSGAGTVTGAGQYQEGESVTVKAAVADGYTFARWTVDGVEVGTGASYTFTMTGDVEVVAVFAKAARLPAGYTEVEYIRSESGNKVVTSVKAIASKTKIKSKWLLETASSYNYIFGATMSSGTSFVNAVSATSITIRFQSASGGSATYSVPNMLNAEFDLDVDYPNKTLTLGGKSVSMGTVNDSSGYLNLFWNGSSSMTFPAQVFKGRCYYFQVYSGDALVADFVPCVNPSGDAGFYDLVSATFYRGTGNGTLVAGPAV